MRLHPQGEIFRWLDRERTQARVDSLDVGAQDRKLFRRGGVDHTPRVGTKTQHARARVDRYSERSQKLRELSRGSPPREIHLEKTILRMQEAESARRVGTRRGGNRRNSKRIALDHDRGGRARDHGFTVDLRQAAAHLNVNPTRRARERDQDDRRGDAEIANKAAGERPSGVRRHAQYVTSIFAALPASFFTCATESRRSRR